MIVREMGPLMRPNENPLEAWMRHMRRGRFEAAWEVSERARRFGPARPDPMLPRHLQTVWDGTPLAGRRVLVRCYHGLGDTLQFVRYLPLVKATAAEMTVWAQPELLPLLRTAAGIDRLLPLHDGAPQTRFDTDVELMELPFVLRTTLAGIPADIPYLHVRPVPRPAGCGRVAVGLLWQSGDWDPRRSLPTAALAPLARVPQVEYYILQQGAARREIGFGVPSGAEDLYNLARLMRGLDLVITVDTMAAHLAGALGVPVWTLLQRQADWRWLEGRDDSPWYPTMRLFRQERAGEWEPVVACVAAALSALTPPSPPAVLRRAADSRRPPGAGARCVRPRRCGAPSPRASARPRPRHTPRRHSTPGGP